MFTPILDHFSFLTDAGISAEIPASVKKEKWSRIGVNTTEDFEPLYIVPKEKKKVVKDLKNALKDATQLLLATDEDREGESISWHLMQILKPKIPTKRMVFHEITKKAINKALDETREIDMELVQAWTNSISISLVSSSALLIAFLVIS